MGKAIPTDMAHFSTTDLTLTHTDIQIYTHWTQPYAYNYGQGDRHTYVHTHAHKHTPTLACAVYAAVYTMCDVLGNLCSMEWAKLRN